MRTPAEGEPALPVPPHLAAAHETYFVRRDWPTALALWLAAGPLPSLDARLALAHCRIELADVATLGPITLDAGVPVRGDWLAPYAHLIRTRAFHWLDAGEPRRAAQLTRLLVHADAHIAALYRRMAASTADASIPRGLAHADTAPLPFQRELMLDDATARVVIERHRDQRILMVIRQHWPGDGAPVQTELCRQLRGVERLGIASLIMDSHPRGHAEKLTFVDRLRGTVAAFRPTVILYDDLLLSGISADEGAQPAVLEILDSACRTFGGKVVLTYLDAWYDNFETLFETAADLAELIHIAHPGLLSRLSPAAAAKAFCYPYPMRDLRDPTAAAAQNLRAAFVGSINWTSMSRLAWWSEIAAAGFPVDLHPTLTPLARTQEQYAALLGSYAVSLNLTARVNGRRILTNRTIEAPVYGSLLLEESTDDTAYFMRPFEHYVPFDNLAELATRLIQLLSDAPLRGAIQRAGSAWARQHFGDLHFWARLLWRLERAPALDRPPRTHGFASHRVVIPTIDPVVYRTFQEVQMAAETTTPDIA
jgi:hypothetical protein